jgi:lipopolysaccharide transport system permease protein
MVQSQSLGTELPPVPAPPASTCIRATRGWVGIDWAEMFRSRELLYFLVWRDYKVRYKQAVLGVAWAVLQPVFNMLIFTVVFGHLAKMSSEGYPYAVYNFAALLPWTFFATGVNLAGMSLVNQQALLTKVYFPRIFVPVAAIGVGLLDMAISFGVYAAILVYYRQAISWQVVYLPLLVLATVLATLGPSLALAALTVSYRDFRYVVPFLLQALMYLSPVVYPLSIWPRRFQWLPALNPMTGIIDGYRSAILGKAWNIPTLLISGASTVALAIIGTLYFRKTERRFADIA